MKNALPIDIKEWFCVSNMNSIYSREDWKNLELRAYDSTMKILDTLKKYETKATFFILSGVAEKEPDIVKIINDSGHEIASHGYSQQMITKQT